MQRNRRKKKIYIYIYIHKNIYKSHVACVYSGSVFFSCTSITFSAFKMRQVYIRAFRKRDGEKREIKRTSKVQLKRTNLLAAG